MIISVILFLIYISEIIAQTSYGKHFGTAIIVILVTAVVSNFNIIPANATEAPIYDTIFKYVAPLGIFILLLEVNLKEILKAGLPLLISFLLGSITMAVGAYASMKLMSGSETFGDNYNAIAGMFTGTYSGGSVNFNAVALHYEVMKDGNLFAGAVVVDNIITTAWMAATIALPRVMRKFIKNDKTKPRIGAVENLSDTETKRINEIKGHVVPLDEVSRVTYKIDEKEELDPISLAFLPGLGLTVMWVSELITSELAEFGITVPSVLILTTFAIILAQFQFIKRMSGKRLIGVFTIYIFLSVIGAFCDLSALAQIGSLGTNLLIFAGLAVFLHGVFVMVFGYVFKIDWDVIAVASQANIGGATSALALAKSIDRGDLIIPAVLAGTLGTAVGTYLGFTVAAII